MSTPKSTSLSIGSTVELSFALTRDDTLNLGTITGLVYSNNAKNEKEPLAGAKLSLLNDQDETVAVTYSTADGEFAFYDISDGRYSVLVTAQGYLASDPIVVNISGGNIINSQITLEIDQRQYNGTVNGVIVDKQGRHVPGCFVGLYKLIKLDDDTVVERMITAAWPNQALYVLPVRWMRLQTSTSPITAHLFSCILTFLSEPSA